MPDPDDEENEVAELPIPNQGEQPHIDEPQEA